MCSVTYRTRTNVPSPTDSPRCRRRGGPRGHRSTLCYPARHRKLYLVLVPANRGPLLLQPSPGWGWGHLPTARVFVSTSSLPVIRASAISSCYAGVGCGDCSLAALRLDYSPPVWRWSHSCVFRACVERLCFCPLLAVALSVPNDRAGTTRTGVRTVVPPHLAQCSSTQVRACKHLGRGWGAL